MTYRIILISGEDGTVVSTDTLDEARAIGAEFLSEYYEPDSESVYWTIRSDSEIIEESSR